jgi:hypothetical protein
MSIVGKAGRETERMRERMKAQKRKMVPGRKARVDMTMVGDGGIRRRLERGRIYTFLMGLDALPSGARVA